MLSAPFNETASQTAGPYLHIGLVPNAAGLDMRQGERLHVVAPAGVEGERIIVEGTISDGLGALVTDACVELWQADARGRYRGTDFRGWGRAATDFETGLYRFETIKPGRVPFRTGAPPMAPHLIFWIVARGINLGLQTRCYFDDEPAANEADPVLARVLPPPRRATLLARRLADTDIATYRFDIRLQGDGETVFFDV